VPGARDRLEVVSANLMDEGAFDTAVEGCELVCHTAAVVALTVADPRRDILEPTVEGAKNLLSSVARAGCVKRVVLTSSYEAVISTHPREGHRFTEEDWNEDATIRNNPYALSKVLSERQFRDFRAGLPEAKRFNLISLNPSFVFGPVYSRAHGRTSPAFLKSLMRGDYFAYSDLHFDIVDVRDVADAHVRALETNAEEGRYLVHNGGMWVDEMIRLMREHFPQYPFPRIRFPRFMAYLAAVTDKRLSFAFLRNHLGRVNRIDNGRSMAELGIRYRPLRDSIVDTCRSFLDTGVVRPR
jgi:dihydroflavonol-4-reductase